MLKNRGFAEALYRRLPPVYRRRALLGVLMTLAAIGMIGDVRDFFHRIWEAVHREVVVQRVIKNGVAISMNALERQLRTGTRLPGMNLQGVLIDRRRDDWILFGEVDAHRPGLPVDAITIAVRAARLSLEAPGIDIQPQTAARQLPFLEARFIGAHVPAGDETSSSVQPPSQQEVRYFGGVADTVIGDWFFKFDHWMKRVSLDQESAAVPGIPIYWRRAVSRLEREVQACTSAATDSEIRRNRYWLCAGEFKTIQDEETLVFQETPLHVLAERGGAPSAESPCVSRGTDDPLAAEFAEALDKHLADVTDRVPIREIQQFARTLAAVEWLAQQDPSRPLRSWLEAQTTAVPTPMVVPTLVRRAIKEHLTGAGIHRHELQLSGGVIIAPVLGSARPAGDWLSKLRWTVSEARPSREAVVWHFAFNPNGSELKKLRPL